MRFTKEIALSFLVIGIFSSIFYILFGGSICFFINFWGIPCPSCGITRAFINLLKLDLKSAFKYHPLFWLVLFIPFTWKTKKIFYGIFTIFILFWIIRMYLYFPNIEPMIFNKDAFFIKIFKQISKDIFS